MSILIAFSYSSIINFADFEYFELRTLRGYGSLYYTALW